MLMGASYPQNPSKICITLFINKYETEMNIEFYKFKDQINM